MFSNKQIYICHSELFLWKDGVFPSCLGNWKQSPGDHSLSNISAHGKKMFWGWDLAYKFHPSKEAFLQKPSFTENEFHSTTSHLNSVLTTQSIPPVVARLQCLRFMETPCTILESWIHSRSIKGLEREPLLLRTSLLSWILLSQFILTKWVGEIEGGNKMHTQKSLSVLLVWASQKEAHENLWELEPAAWER